MKSKRTSTGTLPCHGLTRVWIDGLTQDNSKFLLFLWNGLEEAPELVLQKDFWLFLLEASDFRSWVWLRWPPKALRCQQGRRIYLFAICKVSDMKGVKSCLVRLQHLQRNHLRIICKDNLHLSLLQMINKWSPFAIAISCLFQALSPLIVRHLRACIYYSPWYVRKIAQQNRNQLSHQFLSKARLERSSQSKSRLGNELGTRNFGKQWKQCIWHYLTILGQDEWSKFWRDGPGTCHWRRLLENTSHQPSVSTFQVQLPPLLQTKLSMKIKDSKCPKKLEEFRSTAFIGTYCLLLN